MNYQAIEAANKNININSSCSLNTVKQTEITYCFLFYCSTELSCITFYIYPRLIFVHKESILANNELNVLVA
jgi:hypothetical protein